MRHLAAIVAEDAHETVKFESGDRERDITSSWIEGTMVHDEDLFDFSVYMDEVRHISSRHCKDEHDTFSGSAHHSISCTVGASSSIFCQAGSPIRRRY